MRKVKTRCKICGESFTLPVVHPRVELFLVDDSWVYIRTCKGCLRKLRDINQEEFEKRLIQHLKSELKLND